MNKVTRTAAMDKVKADSISRIETAARTSRYSNKLEPPDSGMAAAARNTAKPSTRPMRKPVFGERKPGIAPTSRSRTPPPASTAPA